MSHPPERKQCPKCGFLEPVAKIVECMTCSGASQERCRDCAVWCHCMQEYYSEEAHRRIPCHCQDEALMDRFLEHHHEYNCMEDEIDSSGEWEEGED